jgi:hypothetical protein
MGCPEQIGQPFPVAIASIIRRFFSSNPFLNAFMAFL